MANVSDPNQMPHSVASDLGLHCLLMLVCSNTLGYYGKKHIWLPCWLEMAGHCDLDFEVIGMGRVLLNKTLELYLSSYQI